jgi:predicted TIM-barrel fold metal-dependent hydrolase
VITLDERPLSRSQEIRRSLNHPIVDGDGHTLDLLPVLLEFLSEVGGSKMVDRLKQHPAYKFVVDQEALGTTLEQRRYDGRVYDAWWGYSGRTLDRATAMLPALLEERMEEIGIDFAILFPSESAIVHSMQDDDMRLAGCRAHNMMSAELFGAHKRSMTPTAIIPMGSPAEAVAELEYAIGVLGLKAVNMGGSPRRQIPKHKKELPAASPYITRPELFGIDSDHDYDAVWAKCQELKVAPCFHAKEQRQSISSYVYNHVGAFAQGNETICKALFLGGVTRRFPNVNFGFLEGGAAWACSLFADLISHWEKRGGQAIESLDPAGIDVDKILALLGEYGGSAQRRSTEAIQNHLRVEPPRPEYLDEFAACEIRVKGDFYDLFVPRFFFGCEADAPLDTCAFNPKINPFGATLQAMLGSDIGHWDVPDIRGIVEEAYEHVDHGLMTEDDFEKFAFSNIVRLHGGMNPSFFEGTNVEKAASSVLAGAA